MGLRSQNLSLGAKMIDIRPEFRFSSQIWPILPGFGPFWLDLGHFAWILAIQLGFGPQRRQSPEGGAEGGDGRTDVRTYGRTDGQIPPVFYRTSSPSGPLPKKQVAQGQYVVSDTHCPALYVNDCR